MRLAILPLLLALIPATCAIADPEIFSLDPEMGPAGTAITLKGKGLKDTGHVAFAVGQTVKPAKFKVISDQELEVIAPEYYRPLAAATVAVFARAGVGVTMPATTQEVRTSVRGAGPREPGASFYHVLDGGTVTVAGSVALIESGGLVERGGTAGMHFVKRGGMLLGYENPRGIAFYEPGAIFGPNLSRSSVHARLVPVPSVTGSPGVGPFVYEGVAPYDPGNAPTVPPQIRSFEPPAASAGDIITLRGRGFARTSVVLTAGPRGIPRPAGFRVVADDVLKVEIPDERLDDGPENLIVVSSEGVTVTVPRDRAVRAGLNNRVARNSLPFGRVGSGEIAAAGGMTAVFVERGGILTDAGGASVFVQAGGRLLDDGRAPAALYYEHGAAVPERLKVGQGAVEVPHIVPSFVPSPFVVLPGPVFRH